MKYLLSTFFFLTAFSCFSQVTTPPPPATQIHDDEVFKVVEDMPRFPGCEDQNLGKTELRECAQTKMLEYIYDNLVYPQSAKVDKVEGMAVVQFKIEKDGKLENIRVVRNPGSGTGEAAAAVIHKMNTDGIRWIPGKQRGRKVVVQYTLPVRFALSEKTKD